MPWREHYMQEANGHSSLDLMVGRLDAKVDFLCDHAIKVDEMFERGETRMDGHEKQMEAHGRLIVDLGKHLSTLQAKANKPENPIVSLLKEIHEVMGMKQMALVFLLIIMAIKSFWYPEEVKALVLALIEH